MPYLSDSQTCSSRYPNQGRVMFYYSQYFAVVAHNVEQHCGFDSASPRSNTYYPQGVIFTPSLGNTGLSRQNQFLRRD